MTISRGQMERQLRMGGGIMDVVPREPAIFGGIKRAAKKVVKGVKNIASSDVGKAALLYAGTAGLGALGAGTAAKTSGFGGIFNPRNVMSNLGGSFLNFKSTPFGEKIFGTALGDTDLKRSGSIFSKAFEKIGGGGNVAKLAGLAGVSTFLTGTLGMTEEQAEEELARDPSKYLELYYRNLNPPTADTNSEEYETQVREFVSANTSEYAEGGRIGFDNGGTYEDFEKFMMRRSESLSERQKEELRKQFEMYMRSKEPTVEAAEGIGSLAALKDLDLMTIKATLNQVHTNNDDGEGGGINAVMKFMEKNPEYKVQVRENIIGDQGDKIMVAPIEEIQAVNILDQLKGDILKMPENKAQGGRIGYALGGNELPPDPTKPIGVPPGFKPVPIGPVLPNKEMASNEISIDKIEMLIKRGADNDLIKEFTGASDGVIDQIRDAMERKNKAGGGIMNRMNYALGDTASQNAMQAASVEGLPVRQNPKGIKELDLRDNGGFIPPVGIKEKEDDIPAMLSNNEFVFTADAVRGMGDGNVNVGAQRMYDMMKKLEAGGRV